MSPIEIIHYGSIFIDIGKQLHRSITNTFEKTVGRGPSCVRDVVAPHTPERTVLK